MRFNKDPAVVKAGFVHLLTASGALIALLSLQAIYHNDAKEALMWLLLALVIDGLDGPLARKFEVKKHMPQIDGVMLDLIVDFLSYVFVPVVYIWHFELLPQALEWLLLGAILLSSLYLFALTDMKSDDNYFNGFPSVWNLVLFSWVILDTPLAFNVLSTAVLCVLTFVPIKSVHPVRVKRFKTLNVALVVAWAVLSAVLIMALPDPQFVLQSIWVLIIAWFICCSFWRTLVG